MGLAVGLGAVIHQLTIGLIAAAVVLVLGLLWALVHRPAPVMGPGGPPGGGPAGVREPRRPQPSPPSDAIALPIPVVWSDDDLVAHA